MIVMECRRAQLQLAIDGYKAAETPLLSLHNGTFGPAGYADDQGIYYFIPWIAKTFGITVDLAIDIFFGSLLLTGILITLCCFFSIFKQWTARFVALGAISLLATYSFSDVYTCSFFAVAATLPLFILYDQKKYQRFLPLAILFSGIILGYSNIIRSHSGTGVFLFILSWIALSKDLKLNQKFVCTLILIASSAIPYFHFNHLDATRDQYLSKVDPTYKQLPVSHPKWHAIYLGLGYLKNNYGIEWNDTVALEKSLSINPNVVYCSEEYEEILKDQCFSIGKSDPVFVIKTFLIKTLVVLYKVIKFTNFGLLFLLFVRPSIRTILPFFVAASFFSLPGIIVMPFNVYLIGMFTVCTLFGIYMIGLGVQKYVSKSQSSMKYV